MNHGSSITMKRFDGVCLAALLRWAPMLWESTGARDGEPSACLKPITIGWRRTG